MATLKRSLMVVSLCLAFIAWGALFPTLTIGSVQVETADFGEVAVGSTSTIPLVITNTGSSTLILNLRFENYSCSFFLDRQSDIPLNPTESITVNMSWTPPEGSEGTTCSDTLKILNGNWDVLETVLVTGTAVEAGQSPKTPNTPLLIGGCDTGVKNERYKGKAISEWIDYYAADAKNHGQFVSYVAHLTNELKAAGLISDKEKGAIQRCAAKANLPRSMSSRRP
jgi:hypothetical protein